MYARVFCRSERVYMYVMYACVRVSCVRLSVCLFDSEECSACAHWRFRKKTYKTDIMDMYAWTRLHATREKTNRHKLKASNKCSN